MQNLIVLLIVLVSCIFVGRSLFRSYQSGKCSCSGSCSGCGTSSKEVCSPKAQQQGKQGEEK